MHHSNDYFRHLLEKQTKSSIVAEMEKAFPDVISKLYGPTYDDAGNYMFLQIFVVPKAQRNKGKATAYIKRLTEIAKRDGLDIFLTPDDGYQDKDGMTKKDLEAWYKKLGFVKKERKDRRHYAEMCFYA